MPDLLTRLQDICGQEHVSNALVDRMTYRRDCGPTPGGLPGYIVRPESVAEVVELVKVANEYKIPLFMWGRATTFVDFGIGEGCIVLALDLLNTYKIDLQNQVVTADAGVIWHALDSEINKLGWELACPGGGGMFSATVGGTVAYNAVPHAITEYGITADQVIALEVVMPDGSIIHTGSAANDAAGNIAIERGANGPDLAGLFIGSCGTMGIITKATLRLRRIPETEKFLFYAFDELEQIVDAVEAIQQQEAATFVIGIFGGPKPVGIVGEYFMHVIIRDSVTNADARYQICKITCEAFKGRAQDAKATELYWTGHMFSWLRNVGPGAYYSNRPYYCPEVAGFLPTHSLKDAIPAVHNYIDSHKEEWDRYGIRTKGLDVYFSRNAAYLWVDTLYPENVPEAHEYGLTVRADIAELLFSRWMSPGGIVAGIAPYIMDKLGNTFKLMQTLKATLDPNNILNPGVLCLGGEPTRGLILEQIDGKDHPALDALAVLTYQCLRCAFCFDVSWVGEGHKCPSYAYGSLESHSARGRIAIARAIIEGELVYDEDVADRIFSCTLCGACSEHCLKQLDVQDIYQAMREDLTAKGLTPAGLQRVVELTMAEHNPFDKPAGDRLEWLKDKSHVDVKAKTAYFVGCTPSFTKRSMARDGEELLNKLGIDYTIASDEWCCGHPLMSAGERQKAAEFIRHNIETYQALGVERLVFTCPGCYETFKKEMPQVLGEPLPFETLHIAELIAEELDAGRAAFEPMTGGVAITYHDPCTLGRGLGVYAAPRKIIEAIQGTRLAEMPRNQGDSFCCGAGAFVRYDFPELTKTAGLDRWSEAVGTGANLLLTACPACLGQFQSMRARAKDPLQVMDLVNLANKQIIVKETIN
ncbi:MAG: FAD-binding and (Fe-S)-binding domain-containing protein [Chloroflexota bacterium]